MQAFKAEVHERWTWLVACRTADEGDVWTLTHARITLRLPDGREASFEQKFGYGSPWESVEYMWQEGNYSCDCNKALFLARECGIGSEEDDHPCGETIALVKLEDISSRRTQ